MPAWTRRWRSRSRSSRSASYCSQVTPSIPGAASRLSAKKLSRSQVDGHVVQQGGEPCTPVPACHLSHTIQSDRRIEPALSPGRGRPGSVFPSVGRLPSTASADGSVPARCSAASSVLRHRPTSHGRACRSVRSWTFSGRPASPSGGCPWDLPFPVRRVSTHAQGLRLRGVRRRLADDAALGVAFRLA